ncbi:MAG: DUF1553 domain-containing protein [Planctomycetota bacterium]|nr:DUF1553 domain-containing protein [Planctomycetota bacterium]
MTESRLDKTGHLRIQERLLPLPATGNRLIHRPGTISNPGWIAPIARCSLLIALWIIPADKRIAADVDFTRDIRPILAEKCYSCHGPDDAVRQGDLRLDLRQQALAKLPSGSVAIVPGHSARSELIRRIHSTEPGESMPPEDSRKKLNDRERRLLQEWVDSGARYDLHWAFQPVRNPKVPPAAFPAWQRNEVDAFVGKRLKLAQLKPSEPADRVTLIRRLSFDLRGLPPTLAEVDSFVQDAAPDAYEKLVRRFLESVHFGEKLAIDWLDLARFGDTNGYHNDSHRNVWLYRDWVIHAFNSNMRFDQFVREQVAGDLLPDATEQQRIASGFNRNAPFNEEGGADPDEFSVVYAVDRSNTTGQALLGLTMGCAQCHSHKYDPISHREYYEFYAFFNSVEGEPGGGGENGHHGKPVPPTMMASSPLANAELDRLKREILDRSQRVDREIGRLLRDDAQLKSSVLKWARASTDLLKNTHLNVRDGLVLHLDAADVNGDGKPDVLQFGNRKRNVSRWADLSKLKNHADATGDPEWLPSGFQGQHPAVQLDGVRDFLRTTAGGRELADGYTIVAAVSFGAKSAHQMLVIWGDEANGKRRALWRTAGAKPTLSFNGYSADVVGNQPLPTGKAAIALVSQEGAGRQVKLELNGRPGGQGTPSLIPYTGEAITIGANNAGGEKTEAAIGEVLVYNRQLNSVERGRLGAYLAGKFSIETTYQAIPPPVAEILKRDQQDWTKEDWNVLGKHYLLTQGDPTGVEIRNQAKIISDRKKRVAQLQTRASTMVMQEMKQRKPAFVLARGDFQNPGKQVQPNVPAILGRLPEGKLQTRLDLAHWLTREDHPLVSRVRVNHLWKMLLGTGLVRTAGDFGTQGELPSHPELLDWLAHRFVASGWDTKALIHDIVVSATYRQQSIFRKETTPGDPQNRLLSRSPRFRLSAEEIRDMALASSGQLSRVLGGPSVRPFQPPNYFAANSGRRWAMDAGEKSRRRALYTYIQRTAPFPAHLIFDAPSRQICTATRPRTNTPLQALVLMNDPLFLKAAGALAHKTLTRESETVEQRARFLFRSVLSRSPSRDEMDLLLLTVREQHEVYRRNPADAEAFLRAAGFSKPDLPKAELAAWINLAHVVLNLDEAITRE